ncbi:unnamed protein product [Calypogeia fissa]
MLTLEHQVVPVIDRAANGIMDSSSCLGRSSHFVEHLVVATVADFTEGEIVEDLVKELNAAMALSGVLATHVGKCEHMFGGDHTFMIHIRAIDTPSCDAAYSAALEVCGKHLNCLNIDDAAEDQLGETTVVDFYSTVIGALDAKWPAIRIAIFQYKKDTPQEKKESLIQVLSLLPTMFPAVKQVSWGRNIAKERTYRRHYGYADADLGVILGFSSCQDMYALGEDPRYWELLNHHGTSRLERYEVFTLCTTS